jgi:hypothetical protein
MSCDGTQALYYSQRIEYCGSDQSLKRAEKQYRMYANSD